MWVHEFWFEKNMIMVNLNKNDWNQESALSPSKRMPRFGIWTGPPPKKKNKQRKQQKILQTYDWMSKKRVNLHHLFNINSSIVLVSGPISVLVSGQVNPP